MGLEALGDLKPFCGFPNRFGVLACSWHYITAYFLLWLEFVVASPLIWRKMIFPWHIGADPNGKYESGEFLWFGTNAEGWSEPPTWFWFYGDIVFFSFAFRLMYEACVDDLPKAWGSRGFIPFMLLNFLRIMTSQWSAKHSGTFENPGYPKETGAHRIVYNASTIVLSLWFSFICLCYFYEVENRNRKKEESLTDGTELAS